MDRRQILSVDVEVSNDQKISAQCRIRATENLKSPGHESANAVTPGDSSRGSGDVPRPPSSLSLLLRSHNRQHLVDSPAGGLVDSPAGGLVRRSRSTASSGSTLRSRSTPRRCNRPTPHSSLGHSPRPCSLGPSSVYLQAVPAAGDCLLDPSQGLLRTEDFH
ncbi:hypothetical protein ACOMHN_035049 [Nucella lapillus]